MMNYKKMNMLFLLSAFAGGFLVHTGAHAANQELLFKCTVEGCRMAFATSRALTTHTRTHARNVVQDEGPNLMRCEVCGAIIVSQTAEGYNRHWRQNHQARVMQADRPAPGVRRQQQRDNRNNLDQQREAIRQGLAQLQLGQQQQQQPQDPAVMQDQQQQPRQPQQE